GLGRRAGRSEALHQAALAAGGLVLVDDALRRRLVDPLDRQLGGVGIERPGVGGGDGRLHARLDLRLDRLVAQASGLVLLVALDLGLDVCHGGKTVHAGRYLLQPMSAPKPQVAVAPEPAADWVADAVRAGGGDVVPIDAAEALVWTSPRGPGDLRAVLAASPRPRWVQLP